MRALQSFISHAPLQPRISHVLPPMYQELSLLIRQLSLLSAQVQIGGESSLSGDLFDVKPAKVFGYLVRYLTPSIISSLLITPHTLSHLHLKDGVISYV